MKKIYYIIFLFLFLVLTGCTKKNDRLTIISTSFPGYDFARAITRNSDIDVKMLLKPGSETHDFEPTPQDIINIKNSDIFIYVGGDSDEWIDDVLGDIKADTKIIKLMDLVDTVEEESVDGMEGVESDEEDEHVWTSPINAIAIVDKLKDEIISIDSNNNELYRTNASNYIEELNSIDSDIRDIVKNSKRKELVFGDRFPFRYFVDEYGLSYYAAFPGCSEQTEASAKTLTFLINKVKDDKIPVVFHIELSSGKIANAISHETGARVLEFNSAHNISNEDFNNGVTITDIMRSNVSVLKEALN